MTRKWHSQVNNFIESFNGDTDRVTLSGCSAGGQSALAHAVSEDSWPYFKQVSQYSGPLGIPYFNADQAVQIYDSVAKESTFYFFVNLIVQLMHQTKPFATLTKLSWVMIWAFFELESWNHLLHQFKVIFVPLLHHYLHFWIAHMIRSAIDRQSQAPGQMTNGHTILTVEANWIGIKWANHQKNNHFHFLLCWFLYPS